MEKSVANPRSDGIKGTGLNIYPLLSGIAIKWDRSHDLNINGHFCALELIRAATVRVAY